MNKEELRGIIPPARFTIVTNNGTIKNEIDFRPLEVLKDYRYVV